MEPAGKPGGARPLDRRPGRRGSGAEPGAGSPAFPMEPGTACLRLLFTDRCWTRGGRADLMEIAELLDRCRRGDPLAWEFLVRQHQGRVYGLALHYLGDPEEARDAAQDVFVRIYRNLDATVRSATFVPWMIRIARNACIDRLRRRRARPVVSAVPVEEFGNLSAPTPAPDRLWHQNRRRSMIREALDRLSPINREVILLKEIQGLSLEEVAETLGVPVGTVKSRSSRARIELAKQILSSHEEEALALGGEDP